MNYLDLGIIIVLGLGLIMGAKRGLIISILNILGLIAGILVSYIFTKTFSMLIYNYTDIPKSIGSVIQGRVNEFNEYTKIIINKFNSGGASMVDFLTQGVIYVASFLILFIVVTIIISILKQGIRKNLKKSFFGPIDSVLGGILGVLKWIIILNIGFVFIIPILPILSEGNQFYTLISGSTLANLFIKYNIITILLKGLIVGSVKGVVHM
ncbi:MAG: CvpA family protein [Clostridium sp.]